jgi:beta-N-acetylhexosaminidase
MLFRVPSAACLICALLHGAVAAPPAAPAKKPRIAARSSGPGYALARRLPLRERIAQLIVVRGYGDYLRSDTSEYRNLIHWIRDLHIGGMIVANRVRGNQVINAQPFEMAAFLNHLQRLSRTPLIFASDFERGASMRVAETARYPYMMAFGAAHDLAAVRELGAATAREAHALGITWVFAPDADVNNNPDNPIINTRSFGEVPQAVAEAVGAFVEGAHEDPANYVLVTPKHFPGHGDTGQDSHMQLARIDHARERIESVELVPFRAAIAHGADAIMTAHMAVPAFEPQAVPATVSRNILTGLLREELGFKGLVVTDAMDMQGVTSLFSQGEAAVRAVEAGADVVLMPADPEACIRGIVAAVKSGRLSEARVTESAARILAAKQRAGLFRNRTINLDAIADKITDPKLAELAQRVSDEAFTLVKDSSSMFPIREPATACSVVLTENRFSSIGQVLFGELSRRDSQLKTFVANPTMPESELSAIATAIEGCSRIYAVASITVGAYRGSVSLEGGLGGFLSRVVKGKVPTALISLGSPYLFRDYPDVSAYAATFSTASTAENTIARAMFGEVAIRGKLPVSIPGLAKAGDGIEVSGKAATASDGVK